MGTGLGFTLIERYGARGSKLTEEGKKFLELYDRYDEKVETYAKEAFEEVFQEL